MTKQTFQSYPSYRLSRFSLTEPFEEIEPLFFYSSRDDGSLDWHNIVDSDQEIDDIKGMFLLTSDTDDMEWVPAYVVYPGVCQ